MGLKGVQFVLGLSVEGLTQVHVVFALLGLVLGIAALVSMINSQRPGWITHAFLVTMALTAITGFMFPVEGFTAAVGVGMITTICLWPAFFGLYLFQLEGFWRGIFVVAATAALYLNCYALVVQAFEKISFLNALAPTQREVPYLIVQIALLATFVHFGWQAVDRFHPPKATTA